MDYSGVKCRNKCPLLTAVMLTKRSVCRGELTWKVVTVRRASCSVITNTALLARTRAFFRRLNLLTYRLQIIAKTEKIESLSSPKSNVT